MPEPITLLGIYFAVINFLAIIMTIYDKRAAQSGLYRVKERTLFLLSVFGGSIAMFAVMWIIRHKTKHLKFILGIPAIIAMQFAATLLLYRWL